MNKPRTYLALALTAIALATFSGSLLWAKPKVSPAEQRCNDVYDRCCRKCRGFSSPGSYREACLHNCDVAYIECGRKAGGAAHPAPSALPSISPRPTLAPRTQDLKSKSSPTPTPQSKRTPNNNHKH